MAIPGWLGSGILGGLAGAAEGDRANKGQAFLKYYMDKLKQMAPPAVGGVVGGTLGSKLPGVLGKIGGPLGAGVGVLGGAALGTDAAAEARERGRRGFLPEFGLSEGLGQLIPGLQNVNPVFRPGSPEAIAQETFQDQAMNPQAWAPAGALGAVGGFGA